jgi:prepilin-type N-terminal cleavage/methylation domain-containing protein
MTYKKNQSGFTIIELLIVVIVIGILTTLVIVTYSGIQMKNRDTKRKNDVEAIGMQLEVYNATTGSYPALHELQDNNWATTNLKNFNVSHLTAPGAKSDSISNVISTKTYQYVPGPDGCTTAKRNCSTFTLTAKLESGNTQPVVVRNVSN